MRMMVSYKIYFENFHATVTKSTGSFPLLIVFENKKLSVSCCCALCKMHNYTFPFEMRNLVVEKDKKYCFGITSLAHQQILRQ